LAWNVAGRADAYADAATAIGCAVDDIADVFASLCGESRLGTAISTADMHMSVEDIAATMNAIENQPMLNNNSRAVTDDDRRMLAARTVEVWHGLRS
jgi:hypothetical protein